jgi:MFS family permease
MRCRTRDGETDIKGQHLSKNMTAFTLERSCYRTLLLTALGGALEYYDFVIFAFFASVIGQLFFPSNIPPWLRELGSLSIFAAAYFARTLGGIVMAHYGDLFGRKRMFTMSVLLMAMPTIAISFLPTYATIGTIAPILLVVFRILQGAAVGGEVPGAWVFVSEHVSSHQIGFACGTLMGGLAAGILFGSVVAIAMNGLFTPAQIANHVWRIPFLIGGLFGVLSMYLRRWLQETPVFIEMKHLKLVVNDVPVKVVLLNHIRSVIVSMLLTWMLAGVSLVVILMTPILMQQHFHINPLTALYANCLATIGLAMGCIIAGLLADRFGVIWIIFIGGSGLAISYSALFYCLTMGVSMLFPLYALTGFFVGVIGAIPTVMVKIFPPNVRYSGVSFSYNIAYAIFGGLTPIIVSLMTKLNLMAPPLYVGALCLLGSLATLFSSNVSLRQVRGETFTNLAD